MPDSAQVNQLKAAIEAQTDAIRLQADSDAKKVELETRKLELQREVADTERQRNKLLSTVCNSMTLLNDSHSIIIDMLYEDVIPSMIDDYRIMTTLIDSIKQLFILIAEFSDDNKHTPEISRQVKVLDDILASERKRSMQKELLAHIRRLDILKERRATQGIAVEASVVAEIENIESSISVLRNDLSTI